MVIACAGDILLDRGVRTVLERRTLDDVLGGAAPALATADLAIANLECPLSRRGLRSAKPFSFRGDPEHARALERAGFDALSLANNHSLDYGRAALADTIAALEGVGILPIGAGATRAAAMEPRIVERNGLRVALLGYCAMFVEATTPRPDLVTISEQDEEAFLASIRNARAASDVVVVVMHWGREWSSGPTESQRALVSKLLAAGATIVVGAHPHVLQPVEMRGDRLVAWSLGNFVFDQRGEGADSCVLRVRVSRRGVEEVEAVPFVIRDGGPVPADGADAERIRGRLSGAAVPGTGGVPAPDR